MKCSAIVAALAAVLFTAPSSSATKTKSDTVPTFSGPYLGYTHIECDDGRQTSIIGAYTFHTMKKRFDVIEYSGSPGSTRVEEAIINSVPYSNTADTFTLSEQNFNLQTVTDRKNVVRSANLIGVVQYTDDHCIATYSFHR